MPQRLTPQQAADLGLHAPAKKRLTPQEAAALGLHAAPKQTRAVAPDDLVEEGGLSHGPGTAGALNALDALSIVGLPTTLAMKDALTGSEGDFRSRYAKAKAGYEGGMKRLADSNPKTAFAGQFAPLLTPGGAAAGGAKLLPTLKRGAMVGLASGAARGPAKTIEEGDWKGTIRDAAIGSGAGVGLAAAGSAAGKLVEGAGTLARKGMGKVLDEVKKRTASSEGMYAKIQSMGQGARRNLPADIEAAEKTVPIGKAAARQVEADKMLAREAVAYGENAKRDAIANKAKWGHRAAPPAAALDKGHMADIQKESWQGLKQLAGTAALTAGGYAAGKKLGVDPYLSGLAAGGAGAGFLVRKAALNVARNPAALQQLMKLEPFGQLMARQGAKGASAPQNVAAIVYALREHPEVARVLKENEASPSERP